MQKFKRERKGITLVVLVVTIIILLILASITINFILGDSGILKETKEATNEWEKSVEKEESDLAKLANEMKDIRNRTEENKDKEKPVIIEVKVNEVDCENIEVNAKAKDNQSGIYRIEWYYKEETESAYQKIVDYKINNTENGESENNVNIIDLKWNTKYSIYIRVYDKANNYAESDVIEGTTLEAVAQIENKGYSKIQKAVDAIPNNNVQTTIKQLKNAEEAITINTNKNIKLIGDNNILEGEIVNNGTLEIASGNITYKKITKSGTLINNKGTLVVSGGKISSVDAYTINNQEGSKVKIIDGEITKRAETSNNAANIHNKDTAMLEISGGKIYSEKIGESGGGTNIFNYGECHISGGNITSINENNIQISKGNVEMIGGTIYNERGGSNIVVSGKLVIRDGTISCTNTIWANIYNGETGIIEIYGGNIYSDKGAIYNTQPGGSGYVNISGGTLRSTTTDPVIGNEKTLNVSGGNIENTTGGYSILNNQGTVNITGGTIIGTRGY